MVFRHIGGVYTIIGAFCQETQARATPISVYHGVVQADFACLGGVG